MIPYQDIVKAVALRTRSLRSGDAFARNTDYSAPNIAPFMDGTDVLFRQLRQDVLATELELVQLIASSNDPVLKRPFLDISNPLPSNSLLPNVSASGNQFFGIFDGVFDAFSFQQLTEMPVQFIYRYLKNPNGFWKSRVAYFSFHGQLFYHTVTLATLRGVAFNPANAEAQFDANGNSALHPTLKNLWIAKTLALQVQEEFFGQEALYYQKQAQILEQQIFGSRGSLSKLPKLPEVTARPDPIRA